MESSQSPHRPLPEPQTMGTPSSPAAGPCSANAPSADTPAAGYRRGRCVGVTGGEGPQQTQDASEPRMTTTISVNPVLGAGCTMETWALLHPSR